MSESKAGEVQVFEYENAIVRVHRPVLTEDERARRMKEIKRAAEKVMLEVMALERRKHGKYDTCGSSTQK